MTSINKVPVSKVNNTLTRVPITGRFDNQLNEIDKAAEEIKAAQSTVLGKTINETISGVKALTQPDEYPSDILSEPPIAQITEEADPSLKKVSAQVSNINKMTSSSLSGDGFMNAHIMNGTPQAMKNGIFKATKTNIIPICVSIKPIFENIIKIGKLRDIPGIVLVNIINKKYLFLCLKLCLAKPYPPIVTTNTAINVLVKEIISEFRK